MESPKLRCVTCGATGLAGAAADGVSKLAADGISLGVGWAAAGITTAGACGTAGEVPKIDPMSINRFQRTLQ